MSFEPEPSQTRRHLSDLVDPDTQTVILVPGLDGTAELFYRQMPLLSRLFNVVAFPLPNKRRATMDELVTDLAELIREVSPGPAILCGESFGGALSMSLALREPSLVDGLVIVNSFPYLQNRVRLAVTTRLARLVPWAAMPVVRRVTEHRLHSPHILNDDLKQFRRRMLGIERDGYIRRLEILADYDIRNQLQHLAAPTLFIAGSDDRLLPSVHWARFMDRATPDSQIIVLDGYGHCCLINHDLDLAALIEPWWNSLKIRSLSEH